MRWDGMCFRMRPPPNQTSLPPKNTKPPGGRFDIILDNSGLELYTDLLLADYLITSGQAGTVALHGKLLPWFVSDVMAADLEAVVAALEADAPPAGMQVRWGGWMGGRAVAAVMPVCCVDALNVRPTH
jgi:hypothetical protein